MCLVRSFVQLQPSYIHMLLIIKRLGVSLMILSWRGALRTGL